MDPKIIFGKEISSQIREELRQEITKLKEEGIIPGLATILVGDDPASKIYVRNKAKACEEIGILSHQYNLPKDTKEEDLVDLILRLNDDLKIHGILLQLPLPKGMDETKMLELIDPKKDVDGFHPMNVGFFMSEKRFSEMKKKALLLPCTPHGIIEILLRSGVKISGKEAVVLGRSNIVGKPVFALLMANDATVTICHSRTSNIKEVTRRADILIAAIGSPKFVRQDMVKEGVVVIDVGINRTDEGLVGDVDFDGVKEKAALITPVPGGVGPMTVTMLLANTVRCVKKAHA